MKIFVSHSSADQGAARAMVELLQAAMPLHSQEIRCTSVDGYGLPPGVDFNDRLRQETYEADVLVALLTPSALRSTYVLFELGARWAAKRYMAPMRLGGLEATQLQGPLSTLHSIDATNARQLEVFVSALAEHLSLPRIENVNYKRFASKLRAASKPQLSAAATEIAGQPDDSQRIIEAPQSVGVIAIPAEGAHVPQRLQTSGRVFSLRDGDWPWLLVWATNGQIYPQARLSNRQVPWTAEVRIGRVGAGLDNDLEYVVELAAAGADTNYHFEKYLRGESESKDGLGAVRPTDLVKLDSRRVIRTG
jgi:hypothetical protein